MFRIVLLVCVLLSYFSISLILVPMTLICHWLSWQRRE